jgi:hypothetical protein
MWSSERQSQVCNKEDRSLSGQAVRMRRDLFHYDSTNISRTHRSICHCLANNVQDFSELTFVVTYDPNLLEIVDLYDFSPEKEVVSGSIAGTNLFVNVTSGRIEFTVNRNIVPGTSWSGEITTIMFKPKASGQTSIDVTVE